MCCQLIIGISLETYESNSSYVTALIETIAESAKVNTSNVEDLSVSDPNSNTNAQRRRLVDTDQSMVRADYILAVFGNPSITAESLASTLQFSVDSGAFSTSLMHQGMIRGLSGFTNTSSSIVTTTVVVPSAMPSLSPSTMDSGKDSNEDNWPLPMPLLLGLIVGVVMCCLLAIALKHFCVHRVDEGTVKVVPEAGYVSV